MARLLILAAFSALPALAEVTFPRWGSYYDDGQNNRGLFYNVERVGTTPHLQFEVEMRPMSCDPIAVQNPKCSFDYAEVSYSNRTKTVVKKTSKYNSLHCKTEKYINLAFISKPVRLWDSFGDFSDAILRRTKETESINGELLRSGEHSFLDASCVTFDTPAGTN